MHVVEEDKKYVWHPFTPLLGEQPPLPVVKASGVWLELENGKKIIDAISSWWVNLHGHCHPHIVNAIQQQLKQLDHVIFAGFTHEPAVQLAQNLLQILPQNQTKIFFSDNGSTAVEVGIKMAFQYWYNQNQSKTNIIALEGAYHGDTFGAMSVANRDAFTAPFFPFLFETSFIPFPTAQNQADVIQRFEQLAESGNIAAFIYEPLVQGAAGMRMYDKNILQQLLEIAKQHQIICIADEVMTGFGRTLPYFASQQISIQPDIICMSKGITGGFLPMGATSCTEAIIEVFRQQDILKTFFHGHSYTANPLACAAANASYELLVQSECMENRNRIAAQHQIFLQKIATNERIINARSMGTILAVEVKTQQKTGYLNELRNALYYAFIAKNILIRPLGNVIYVLPPYTIQNEELQLIYDAIEIVLNAEQL
jgi:adenosylmethionine-8-amino-7-oxononanoate aminotransferase